MFNFKFDFKVLTNGEFTTVMFPEELGGGFVNLKSSGKPGETALTAVKAVLYGDYRTDMMGNRYQKRAFWRQFCQPPTSDNVEIVSIPAARLFAFATPLLGWKATGSAWGDGGEGLEIPIKFRDGEGEEYSDAQLAEMYAVD